MFSHHNFENVIMSVGKRLPSFLYYLPPFCLADNFYTNICTNLQCYIYHVKCVILTNNLIQKLPFEYKLHAFILSK